MSARLIADMEAQARKCRDQAAGFKTTGSDLALLASTVALSLMMTAQSLKALERAIAEDASLQAEA